MPDNLISKKQSFEDLPLVRTGGSILFFFAFGVFVLALALYGGLLLYNGALAKQLATAREDLTSRRAEFNQGTINQLISLDKKLTTAKILLAQHIFSSNVFSLLEKLTHPRVRFTSFLYSTDARKVDMQGEAGGYAILARQIGLLETSAQIEKVDFGGLSLGDKGLVNFKVSIILKPDFLRLNP